MYSGSLDFENLALFICVSGRRTLALLLAFKLELGEIYCWNDVIFELSN